MKLMDIILKIDIYIYICIQFIYKIIGYLTKSIKKSANPILDEQKEKVSKKVDERKIKMKKEN